MVAAAGLPIPAALHVEALLLADDGLTILASPEGTDAPCPLCGQRSSRVHSRYARTLAELPWAKLAVRLPVQVRKFFCDNAACPRQVFAERPTLGRSARPGAARRGAVSPAGAMAGVEAAGAAGASSIAEAMPTPRHDMLDTCLHSGMAGSMSF